MCAHVSINIFTNPQAWTAAFAQSPCAYSIKSIRLTADEDELIQKKHIVFLFAVAQAPAAQ